MILRFDPEEQLLGIVARQVANDEDETQQGDGYQVAEVPVAHDECVRTQPAGIAAQIGGAGGRRGGGGGASVTASIVGAAASAGIHNEKRITFAALLNGILCTAVAIGCRQWNTQVAAGADVGFQWKAYACAVVAVALY